jgi:hypothetical protein
MKVIELKKSPLKSKRFRATVMLGNNTRYLDFGSPNGMTYIDGATQSKRENYLKRHKANPLEKGLIENLTMSPALLAAKILWGKSRSIENNIESLNKELDEAWNS